MAINNHSSSCPCEQCAPAPSVACAPPPVCPTTACEEYILSDCVISTVDENCTSVFLPPNGDDPISVGLTINNGTTLTDVYQQLTSTACIFNPNVLGAILQIMGDPGHPQYNVVLNEILNEIICNANCDDPCDVIVPVSQAVYQNITSTGFDLTFLAQPNYNYSIRINDANQTPLTYYTWQSSVPPNNVNLVPINFTINTSQFTKKVGNPPVTTNPPTNLIAGHTHEIYITAIAPNDEECESGPWTVSTAPSAQCPPSCVQIQFNITADPGAINNFAFIVTFLQGPAFPISYLCNIYDSSGNNMIPVDSILTIPNAPIPDPITLLYPTTNTTYDWPAITADDTYTVEITPICSIAPLYCIGTEESVDIPFAGPPSCNPPDIVSVSIVS